MDRVRGRVAAITGAGIGVGRACMKLFAAEGAAVVGVSRTQANLDETLAEVRAGGGDGKVVAADLSLASEADRFVAEAIAAYGRIDILINAAGVGFSWTEKSPESMNDIVNTTPEMWREVMAINLDSCFFLCRLIIPQMRSQGGGSIVNVGSVAGLLGLASAHTYTAAKSALIGLTRSLCVAYCADNVRANCVVPGIIATPMVSSLLPLFEDPVYLASDEASYCNGSVLVIDGGKTARV